MLQRVFISWVTIIQQWPLQAGEDGTPVNSQCTSLRISVVPSRGWRAQKTPEEVQVGLQSIMTGQRSWLQMLARICSGSNRIDIFTSWGGKVKAGEQKQSWWPLRPFDFWTTAAYIDESSPSVNSPRKHPHILTWRQISYLMWIPIKLNTKINHHWGLFILVRV